MLFLCLLYFLFYICFIMYNFLCCCFFTFKIFCMLLTTLYCIDDLVLYCGVFCCQYCIFENWKSNIYYSKNIYIYIYILSCILNILRTVSMVKETVGLVLKVNQVILFACKKSGAFDIHLSWNLPKLWSLSTKQLVSL